jgi:excisionase family DNA binding protein
MNNDYPRPELTLIKPTALAAQLGVSRTWIYDAARDGRIPSVRIGGPEGPLRLSRANKNPHWWPDNSPRQ